MGEPDGRNLIMEVGEHAEVVTFLIRDRDTKFTDRMFAHAGLKILRNPVRAPEGERRLLLSRLLDVRPEPA